MACSCKNKTNNNTQTTVVSPVAQTSTITTQPPVKNQETEKTVQIQYIYTTDTAPLDSCAYCAQKHLGTAITFLKQNQRFAYYQAAGQLQLASYHLSMAPQLAQRLHSYAVSLLNNDIKPSSIQLSKFSVQISWLMKHQNPQTRASIQKPEGKNFYDAMLHACAAYQLLTEPYYQLSNIVYAVGQMCVAAMILRKYPQFASTHQLRQAWKLLQEVSSLQDKQYQTAVQKLKHSIMTGFKA